MYYVATAAMSATLTYMVLVQWPSIFEKYAFILAVLSQGEF